ncbi:MAG: TonB-dependent receptor, partial [Novosphingobium sp.]|nr:TonB-dependent receptor [Novosphingobium sp.]
DPGGLFKERRRATLSARLGWTSADDKYSLAVFGDNLTDRNYDLARIPSPQGGARTPGPPRQVYVQAGVRF